MELLSPDSKARYDDVVAVGEDTLVALDFDGTLAPITADPAEARMVPEAADVLTALASRVAAVAVVTGRSARHVLAVGGLEEIGARFEAAGKELYVFGQYGHERWSSTNRTIIGPRPPAGLASFLRELPSVLRLHDAADAHIEEKGISVAVHTRRMADPAEAYERLIGPLRVLAHQYHLHVEPGRLVIEIRPGGMDKGVVLDELMDRFAARGLLLAGDDLGDVEAFRAAIEWRERGVRAFLVCSASDEEAALRPLSDVAVDGPRGVVELLRQFGADVALSIS